MKSFKSCGQLSKSCQELDVILEKLVQKLKLSKKVYHKKFAPKMIFFNEKKLERFWIFLTLKIDFEFFHFRQLLLNWPQDLKLFNGLVVGFKPKGRPGRMCDSVR